MTNRPAEQDKGHEKNLTSIDVAVGRFEAIRYENGQAQKITRAIALEVPIAMTYGGTTHAVMMATPDNLEDFACGFSLTEGLITDKNEIVDFNIIHVDNGLDIQIELTNERREAFQTRRRHMAGPVGCGLCGVESIDAALRKLPQVTSNFCIKADEIAEAIRLLTHYQHLNATTRATHAAAFYCPTRGLITIREDIGRHNALDKLIGALMRNDITPAQGAIIVTSRLSVEMVQKTAFVGTPVLIAVSAPTAKAIESGLEANITLVARARGSSFEIYSHNDRILI